MKNDFSKLSQGELDDIFAPTYFDFSTRVSSVAQIVFLGLVAAPIFPLATPMAMIAIYTSSIVDRYLILRRHSDWRLVGSNLGLRFQNAYSYNMFVQVIGALLFAVLILPKSDLHGFDYTLIFVAGLGYLYTIAKFLAPIIKKGKSQVKDSKCFGIVIIFVSRVTYLLIFISYLLHFILLLEFIFIL